MSPQAVADVQSRILAIQGRLGSLAAPRPTSAAGGAFAGALDRAVTAAGSTATVKATAASDGAARPSGPTGADVVAAAKRYLGVPYLWGGTDPDKGLDCSGLVRRVYADLGIELDRVSKDQAREGRPVASLAEARPGDLLAFDNSSKRAGVDHIAIYLGDGKMIEAPRPGKDVRIADVPGTPVAIRRILSDVAASGEASGTATAGGSSAAGGSEMGRSALSAPGRSAEALAQVYTPVAGRVIYPGVPLGSSGTATASSAATTAPAAPVAPPATRAVGRANDGLPSAADPYIQLFRAAASRYGVPAELLAAVAKAESGFRADAVSPAGARGLMQIMPGTARELGVDPMVPAQAVDGAARLLKSHLRTFGSTELALAAYNAGPGAVRRYDGIPPYDETRNYVRKVTAAMREISL